MLLEINGGFIFPELYKSIIKIKTFLTKLPLPLSSMLVFTSLPDISFASMPG